MPQYLIYFNQQWVGDHAEELFEIRIDVKAVIAEMKEAGVLVYAGGLDEELDRLPARTPRAAS